MTKADRDFLKSQQTKEYDKIKSGVSIRGIQPEMAIAFLLVSQHFHENGIPCVITSTTEGQHGKASLHYIGHAMDFRTRDLIQVLKDEYKDENKTLSRTHEEESLHVKTEMAKFLTALKESLGGEFDIVLESTHLHVEFQPKGKML